MSIADDIKDMLANQDRKIDREWLQKAQEEYPYFTLPVLMYLQRNMDAEGLDEELLGKLAIVYDN